jgi:hypothetical protein
MPRYYFDIKDGHRFVDPSGATFKNDHDAIERAKAVAIVVSIDKPEVDPTRHISVPNEAKLEIFKAPVYSKPTALWQLAEPAKKLCKVVVSEQPNATE